MRSYKALMALGFGLLCASVMAAPAHAADPTPVTFTAEQDHQNMMSQLKIRSLRPGPSGDAIAPNAANFPSPLQPTPEEMERINQVLKADAVARDPSLKEVFDRLPVYDFIKAALVTMAFDQRFYTALVGSSGEGGPQPDPFAAR